MLDFFPYVGPFPKISGEKSKVPTCVFQMTQTKPMSVTDMAPFNVCDRHITQKKTEIS